MFHYTDADSFKSIASQPIWTFVASQPPGDHPFGAYFTTLSPDTPKLSKRLRIPRAKVELAFEFVDAGDLSPLPGGRGEYVFYSSVDYAVERSRQQYAGRTGDYGFGTRHSG